MQHVVFTAIATNSICLSIALAIPIPIAQPPDTSPLAVNINISSSSPGSEVIVVADDFIITEHHEIRAVAIWGSWKDDVLPQVADPDSSTGYSPDPYAVRFIIRYLSNAPAGDGTHTFDSPSDNGEGEPIGPGDLTASSVNSTRKSAWYDPITNQYQPSNQTTTWKYHMNRVGPFERPIITGTPEQPQKFWFSVRAIPLNENPAIPEPEFGWRTSTTHNYTSALYGSANYDSPYSSPDNWHVLLPPNGIDSIDMAYVVPEPISVMILSTYGLAVLKRR